MIALGYLSAILMGLVLGLIGGGGSVLAVPILVYLFKVPGAEATFYSLFIVGVCAAVGAMPLSKRGLVVAKTGLLFFLPSVVGVLFSRRVLLPALPGNFDIAGRAFTKDLLILILFGVVMIAASWSMLRKIPAGAKKSTSGTTPAKTGFTGVIVGAITGFVGAGGGFLIVPALVNELSLPIEKAIGTSLFIIALSSLSGFSGELLAGARVNWALVLPFLVVSLAGVSAGTYLNRFIPGSKLKPAFGWFVLFLGTGMILLNLP